MACNTYFRYAEIHHTYVFNTQICKYVYCVYFAQSIHNMSILNTHYAYYLPIGTDLSYVGSSLSITSPRIVTIVWKLLLQGESNSTKSV